jgi:hypothetical protein
VVKVVRTIVAFRRGEHCFYVFGFEKSDKNNISQNEEKAMKIIANELFAYSEDELNKLIKDKVLIEVKYEQE